MSDFATDDRVPLRRLGERTDISVTQLALGGLFVASRHGSFAQAEQAVRRAIERGVNYIDTAPTYGDSEAVLGRILASVEVPLTISTKVGGRPTPFDPRDPTHIRASVEESLRLLHRDVLDIVFVHEPDRPGQYDWWIDSVNYSGPVLDVLLALKEAGTIRAIGIAGTTAYELAGLASSGHFDVILTAFNYSLLWREAEHTVLPAARSLGLGIIAGSPLQQGALATRHNLDTARWLSPPRRRQFEALYALLNELGTPLPELAVRFVLSNPMVASVLVGAKSAGEVDASVHAMAAGPLPAEVLARLDEIAAMVPFRPFEEPAGLPFGKPYTGPGRMR